MHFIFLRLLLVTAPFDEELEIAYTLKEELAAIYEECDASNVGTRLDSFIEDIIIFNIDEFRSFARTLKKWKQEIVNSFDVVQGRRISNGPIESLNSRIKLIKRNANGYTNFERFRKRVIYSLNKDSFINFK